MDLTPSYQSSSSRLVKYSKAVHSFTDPNTGNDNSRGAA